MGKSGIVPFSCVAPKGLWHLSIANHRAYALGYSLSSLRDLATSNPIALMREELQRNVATLYRIVPSGLGPIATLILNAYLYATPSQQSAVVVRCSRVTSPMGPGRVP